MDPELIFNLLITTFVTVCVWTILNMATDKRKTEMAAPQQPLVDNDADMITPQERASNAAILSEARRCYVQDLAKNRAIGKCFVPKIGPKSKWTIRYGP